MVMIGGSDNDGVQVGLFEKKSIVSVLLCVSKAVAGTVESIAIDIADRDDILGSDGVEITSTPTANTDRTDIQAVVCTENSAISPSGGRQSAEAASCGSGLQDAAT
jgi:hypothetical protein